MNSVLHKVSSVCKFMFMASFAIAMFKDDMFLLQLSILPLVGYVVAGEEGW